MKLSPQPSDETVKSITDAVATKCDLQAKEIEDIYPCTSLQTLLVVGQLRDDGNYLATLVFDLSQLPYDPNAVKAACESLHAQTPILRTRFVEFQGTVLQVVSRTPLSWSTDTDLQAYLHADEEKPFVPEKEAVRFGWVETNESRSYMVWTIHHACYDAHTLNTLQKDLFRLTRGLQRDVTLKRTPFAKFVKAVRAIDPEAAHDFWKQQLPKLQQCQSLCAHRDEVIFRASSTLEVSSKMDIPKDCLYTRTILSLAAWSLIVAHLSNSQSVLFGNLVDGRTVADVAGIEDICGPTLATVPWQVNLASHDMSIEEFLHQVSDQRANMIPFEQAGMDSYRRISPDKGLETVLDILPARQNVEDQHESGILRPTSTGSKLEQPYAIATLLDFGKNQCTARATYDAERIDQSYLQEVLKKFLACIEQLSYIPKMSVDCFMANISLPKSVERERADELSNRSESTRSGNFVPDTAILNKVRNIAVKISDTEDSSQITPATSLREMGLDSIRTVVLARKVNEEFDTQVPFKKITGFSNSIADIADIVQTTLGSHRNVQTSSEAVPLLKLIEQKTASIIQTVSGTTTPIDLTHAILLTGATGYLGIEILRHCLTKTTNPIVLLVRCSTVSEGLTRVKDVATKARWSDEDIGLWENRVHVWPSDLGAPNLGLASPLWHTFNQTAFSAIIHNGARVNFLDAYHDLEAVNVSSTEILLIRALKLASSTLSRQSVQTRPSFVYVTGGRSSPQRPLTESDLEELVSRAGTSGIGYTQTKLVSELLMYRVQHVEPVSTNACPARQDASKNSRATTMFRTTHPALPMTIVHPGLIVGSSTTGVANPDDFIWRYVATSIDMRCYVHATPTQRSWVNITPVNDVATATVAAATQKSHDFVNASGTEGVNRVSMRSGLTVTRFWELVISILRRREIYLDPVSEWEWLHLLQQDIKQKQERHPLFSLSQMLFSGQMRGIGGKGPRQRDLPSKKEMESVEMAVVANVEYLFEQGFFEDKTVGNQEIRRKNVGLFKRSDR